MAHSDLKPDNIMFACSTSSLDQVNEAVLCSSRVVIINLGECYDAGAHPHNVDNNDDDAKCQSVDASSDSIGDGDGDADAKYQWSAPLPQLTHYTGQVRNQRKR